MDAILGNSEGTIAYRGPSQWNGLGPGTLGQFLETQGAGNPPQWANPSGVVITPGALSGMGLSNDGVSPNSVVDIAAGSVTDDTGVAVITLSAFTKSLAGTWVAGTGSNGLDTGTVAALKWYFVFAISKAGGANPDILLSLSPTAPTFPSGYTLKRRIGQVLTDGSSHIYLFTQFGDRFYWNVPFHDISNTFTATTMTALQLTTPIGIETIAMFNATLTQNASGPQGILFATKGVTVAGVGTVGTNTIASSAGNGIPDSCYNEVLTDTSANIYAQCAVNGNTSSLNITTMGYIDSRGASVGGAGSSGGGHEYEGFGAVPKLANFTTALNGAGQVTWADGTIGLKASGQGNGSNARQAQLLAAPATPWDVYLRVSGMIDSGVSGLVFRNSSSTKAYVIEMISSGIQVAHFATFTAAGVTGGVSDLSGGGTQGDYNWLRAHFDGTTLQAYTSPNGIDWFFYGQVNAAAFLTSIDQLGLEFAVSNNAGLATGVVFSSFSFLAPT